MKFMFILITNLIFFSNLSDAKELFTDDFQLIVTDEYGFSDAQRREEVVKSVYAISFSRWNEGYFVKIRFKGLSKTIFNFIDETISIPLNHFPLKDGDEFILERSTYNLLISYRERVLHITRKDTLKKKYYEKFQFDVALKTNSFITKPKTLKIEKYKVIKKSFGRKFKKYVVMLEADFVGSGAHDEN